MKLQVGLTHPAFEWQLLLDQEKIDYAFVDMQNFRSNTNRFPVLILSSPNINKTDLSHFLDSGGMVVADDETKTILGNKFQESVFFVTGNIKKIIRDQSARHKKFIFRDSFVTEIVAHFPKAQIRKQLSSAIKKAFFKKGLPFVRLGYYPSPYESVFNFRFDLDEYDSPSFDAMCELVAKYYEAITCMVCMRTYENLEPQLRKLTSLRPEIASHAYVHHVYASYTQNHFNLSRAESLLSKYAASIRGFAGPHGAWHESLQRVLEEKKYDYSSEFSVDYDNLPFWKITGDNFSSVLQIPIHPVCEGVFIERRGYDTQQIKMYYGALIQNKYQAREPIFIFGHPTRHPEIVEAIFQQVNTMPRLWKAQLWEIADWWKKRHETKCSFEFEEGRIRAEIHSTVKNLQVEIETANGGRVCVPAENLKMPHTISEIKLQEAVSTQNPIREELVEYSWFKKIRLNLKNRLDWEIKTPLPLLKISSVHEAMKCVLRFFYDFIFHPFSVKRG